MDAVTGQAWLNIDGRRKDGVTLFNPYQERAKSPRLYRSLAQQDQSERPIHTRKKGNNVSRLSKCAQD